MFKFSLFNFIVIQTTFISGAAAASRVFNEALAKIAMNAQHGGTTDIGKCFYMTNSFISRNVLMIRVEFTQLLVYD